MTTSSAQDSGTPILPNISGGDEVYNMIMREIEIDLTTDNVSLMTEKYKDEAPEEKKERMERYKKAFATFTERYKEYQNKQTGDIRSFGKKLKTSVETKATATESDELANLESAMSEL
ncbi:MAG TPA: hypothetical protein DHN29_05660 [Cytophagales bacterium]|jgi:hypothetical protein|nr:hypothetical protein [Cytophagales bacterium]|tara:strand:+ start:936 stop:1289 length:354 start_codon:yes stop_codon:yes gene_type:complete